MHMILQKNTLKIVILHGRVLLNADWIGKTQHANILRFLSQNSHFCAFVTQKSCTRFNGFFCIADKVASI